MKNEKMRRMKNVKKKKREKKKRKNDEKSEKNEEIWIHTQNPRRFPEFTVVVTFFVKILDDFNDFVSECVSFPRKINNPFCGVTVFHKKVTIFLGRETKTHILPTKINEKNRSSQRFSQPFNNNNNNNNNNSNTPMAGPLVVGGGAQ